MNKIALAMLSICACEPVGYDLGVGGSGGAGGAAAESVAVTSGSGGAAPCEHVERPRPLRKVSARDSRGLEPGTLVLAVAKEPQTLWLPKAAGNKGATIIVKEATGSPRRVTVLAVDGDVFLDGGLTEYETWTPWASLTFVSVDDPELGAGWLLLDAVD